jgi:polysaccharide export outer membrane protein
MNAHEGHVPSTSSGRIHQDRDGRGVTRQSGSKVKSAMRAKKVALAMALTLSLGLASCESSSDIGAPDSHGAEAPIAVEDFKLAAGDKIHLTVFNEDNISGDYDIDSEGIISVPLAGLVKAEGLTKAGLEAKVAEKLDPLLKNPRVTIAVVSFRPFYVIGEVEKPGEYQFRNGLNVISAMAIAGGNTYRASKSYVLIQRGGIGEFRKYTMSPSVKVYPGDLVKVPERFF